MELEGAWHSTADGVCAVGADGTIVLWNRAAETILGYASRDVLGRPCCEVFAARDASGDRPGSQGCHVLSRVRRGEPVPHFAMATRTKGGTPVWLDVSTVVDGSTTVHLFRDAGPAPAEATHDARLTPREREILRLLAAGASTRAMAERLRVSVPTVRNHVQNLLGKLGVHSRLEAAAYAMRHGAGLAGEDARPRRRPD